MVRYMKNNKSYNCIPFYYCLIMLACIFSVFYAKFVFYSDAPLHTLISQTILFQDVETNLDGAPLHAYAYPLYHITQKIIHLLLQVDYATAAALLLPITIICSVCMYRKLILLIIQEKNTNNAYYADIISLGAVLFNVARCWLNDWRYYRLQCGANPFHNPTLLFLRPFAIASFIYFMKWVRCHTQKENYKYAALFGVFNLLSIGAKPSYAIVFLPAMGIYTLYHILKNKEIKFGIITLIAVLPSLLLLLFQQKWVSSQIEASEFVIQFGGSFGLEGFDVITASLVTFPVVILLFQFSLLKKKAAYFVAVIALVIGWLQMYLLDFGAGDTSWGYDLAIQFATVITLAETKNNQAIKLHRKILNRTAYVIFAYQVCVGIQYLQMIYVSTLFWF